MSLGPGEGLVQVPHGELLWALGSVCALHRLPFDAALTAREHPPPSSHATLVEAGRKLGLRIREVKLKAREVQRMVFPLIVALRPRDAGADASSSPTLGIVTAAKDGQLILFRGCAAGNQPQPLGADEFAAEFEEPTGQGEAKGQAR